MHFLRVLGIIALQLALPASGNNADRNSQPEQSGSRFNLESPSAARLRHARNSVNSRRHAKAAIAGTSPCTEGFEKPKYQLSEFQLNKTSTQWGDRSMVHFQLNDIANNVSSLCSTPYLQDPSEPIWNECGRSGDDPIAPKTIFRYTASSNALEISQNWICEAQNGTFPRPYFSSATADLTEILKCVDDPTQTRCTIADDAAPQFGGEYTTPVWNSGEVEIIPPSESQPKDTPWNPTPCIGLSFSYPNWNLQDFSYEVDEDDVLSLSFRLRNHANNQSVPCTTRGNEWSNCDDSTSVRFTSWSGDFWVNQTWVCNGGDKYPHNVTFRAVGNRPINTRTANSTVIKGSLTEPIEMTPNVAPEGVNHPGCLETSEAPSWIVTSWVWNEKWLNGYNTGNLTATFYNPSTGFNLTCTGDGEELNRDGRYGNDRWWGCALANNPFPEYRIWTTIKFNPLTEIFSVNQDWSCNGYAGKLPAKFEGEGGTKTTLDCSWNNDTSTKIYIKTCRQTELPFTVPGEVKNRTELPQDVFTEMVPTGYSCTIASVLATQWRTTWSSDTLWTTPTFADTFETRSRFDITFIALDGYQGVGYKGVSMTPFLPTSEPGRWYECSRNGEVTSNVWARNSLDCKWQLDLATGYLAINHTWFCDDKTPGQPIVFTGYGSRFYDFDCYIARRDHNMIECNPTGLNPPPVLPTYLSWKSVPAAELGV